MYQTIRSNGEYLVYRIDQKYKHGRRRLLLVFCQVASNSGHFCLMRIRDCETLTMTDRQTTDKSAQEVEIQITGCGDIFLYFHVT